VLLSGAFFAIARHIHSQLGEYTHLLVARSTFRVTDAAPARALPGDAAPGGAA